MQLDRNDAQLLEMLNRSIRDLQRVEDDPQTMTFIARRLGNIVKHMKDLREDLQPRGKGNGKLRPDETTFRPAQPSA